MTEDLIIETEQIKKSIELINPIENDKFQLLINRVASKIHSNFESFKEDEIEKLKTSLNLNETDSVNQIIDLIEFILLQAAYSLIKPANLLNQLVKIKLDYEKANLLAEIWKQNGKEIIEKIRQSKSISLLDRLKSINWRLNLQLATNLKSKQKLPNALFEFQTANNESNQFSSVLVEFDRDALYDFMNSLENIQKQIDALNC